MRAKKQGQLLNVSYDPTRELYADLNARFITKYERDTGRKLTIKQSHGGSARQAQAVIEGLEADVVTLALPSDIGVLRKRGLIADGWAKRLPNESEPYTSTIVFVVRTGNPLSIKDWPDLVRPGVTVVTPNPKSSGNGKLSFLAAWGSVVLRGGGEEAARDFVTLLYQHAPVLDQGARGAATTFAIEKVGDVHLTWENEASREVADSKGELEIVYPPISIEGEPAVSSVNANVTTSWLGGECGKAYTEVPVFRRRPAAHPAAWRVITPPRPGSPQKAFQHPSSDGAVPPITAIAKDWEEAQQKFFADNGVFDVIYAPKPR